MRRSAIVAFAICAAILMLTAPPAQAATVNYRIADSTSELQNGTLSNARLDAGIMRIGTFESGLKHRYPLNDGTQDVVGGGDFSGTTSQTTGIAGNGRNIDRGETLSGTPSAAGTYSTAFWVNPDGDGTVFDNNRFTAAIDNGNLVVLTDGSTSTTDRFNASVPTGSWTHLAFVLANGTLTVLVDGEFVGRTDDLTTQSDDVTFGGGADGVTGGTTGIPTDWDGQIDEIRMADQTAGELARLPTAPEAPVGGDPALAERWAFDAGGGTVAYGDNGGDATLQNGAGWTTGVSGQAVQVDGSGEHVDTPTVGPSEYTLLFWAKPTNPNDGNSRYVLASSDSNFGNRIRLQYDSDVLRWQDQDNSFQMAISSWSNEWRLVAASYDGSTATLSTYDAAGTQLDTAATSVDYPGGWSSFARDAENSGVFQGQIDDVRIYERALSDSEISYLADHPGAELARGDYVGQARSVDASTGYTEFRTLQNAEATVTWQGYDGSSWTDIKTNSYTTAGNKSVSLPEGQFEQYRPDVSLAPTSPDYRAELDATGVSFAGSAPTLSGPQPTGEQTTFDGTLEIDVSDPDFGDAEGDSVTVTAANQNGQIGSTTVAQNGTATISYSALAGTNDISWSATDSYGDAASSPPSQSFTTPEVIEVRNESDPGQIISTPSNISATFYGSDGETVIEKTSDDGIISIAGVPAGSEYTVSINAVGYRPRRVTISELFEQQSVYLLPETAEAANVQFELNDRTGDFPSASELIISKPITRNGSTEFVAIATDSFGATGSTRFILEDNSRYLLRVESPDGAVRDLGAYMTSGAAVEPLPIGQVSVGSTIDSGSAIQTGYVTKDGQTYLRVTYADPQNRTESLNYTVVNETGAVIEPERSVDVDGEYRATIPVAESGSATVNYSYTRQTDAGLVTKSGNASVGGVPGIAKTWPIDSQVLSLSGYILIAGVTGLLVIRDPGVASIVGTVVASLLTFIGVVQIPYMALGVAGVTAVFYNVGRVR